tara:strand:+ start:2239 stop:2373 length:135 start_codon:yes stop_codon:yes gene_type:complete
LRIFLEIYSRAFCCENTSRRLDSCSDAVIACAYSGADPTSWSTS